MTYLVAIKTGGSVILAADTAITTTTRASSRPFNVSETIRTTFGESTISEPRRCVEGEMNKVIHLGKAAVAFCGDADAAEEFISDLVFSLKGRDDVREAIRISVQNCSRSAGTNSSARIAISFPSDEGAELFTIKTGNWCVTEHEPDGILQLGSMPDRFKQHTKALIERFVGKMSGRPDRLLAVTLGILQSFGTYSALLEESVGGAFCGLAVDSSGIIWQDDILYAIHAEIDIPIGFVHCVIRDNVLIVNSSLIDECRYFAGKTNCPDCLTWKKKWWEQASLLITEAKFGFVTFLNKQHRVTAIVGMAGHRESKLIQFSPDRGGIDEPFRLNMTSSRELIELVTVPLDQGYWKVAWKPYGPFNEMSNQPSSVNRIAAIVTPREPYLSWARNLDEAEGPQIDDMPVEVLTSVYLLEEVEDADCVLRRHWALIFDEILSSWCDDQKLWPRKRTFEMFQEWFETRIVDLVFDLADKPLVHDDA